MFFGSLFFAWPGQIIAGVDISSMRYWAPVTTERSYGRLLGPILLGCIPVSATVGASQCGEGQIERPAPWATDSSSDETGRTPPDSNGRTLTPRSTQIGTVTFGRSVYNPKRWCFRICVELFDGSCLRRACRARVPAEDFSSLA